MHPAYRNPETQAEVDDTGVFRWKGTGLVVCDATLRFVGITDPNILRVNEMARLDEFLEKHEEKI